MSDANSRKRGIDQMLTQRGRNLVTGQSVRFRLIKGPNGTVTADPVDPNAPSEAFPLVARFSDSVVKPQFHGAPWNKGGRLYQQDVPKAVADSDEEEEESKNVKRWKYQRKDVPQRQWILQEQQDFLETMIAKRKRKDVDRKKLSSRYEGVPEHNSSRYAILAQNFNDVEGDSIAIQLLPPQNSTINFAQPAARKTFSLSEAEQVIQDQRAGISVKTMHNHNEESNNGANGQQLRFVPKPSGTKSRLLDKLKASATSGDKEEDGEDVMGDVTFRNRKGGGRARTELLNDLGDGVTVSNDGVLGGTNDTAFGGRQRFGNFQASKSGAGKKAEKTEQGADGAAMADDFYQRDVQAEYDELDYDANEQFDDDDVDLGEAEVVVENAGGYGEENDHDDSDDDSDADQDDEVVTGAAGLASSKGFKQLLAKARGEIPATASAAAAGQTEEPNDGDGSNEVKKDESVNDSKADAKQNNAEELDHIAKIKAAAEKSRIAADKKAKEQANGGAAKPPVEAAIETDDKGLRIISLQAVRREIWLNHGQIQTKRLMKIFSVGKKSSDDRQSKFREVIKELCTMKNDPVSGRMLVLKQHYSNM